MKNFPFIPGEFYSIDVIETKLKLSWSAGIRTSAENKIVVLFWNASGEETKKHVNEWNGTTISRINIYQDYFDETTGLYHYIGGGQHGDQKLNRGNLQIVQAKEKGRTIHLFRQYIAGEKRQYVGRVEYVQHSISRQPDADGKERKAYVFVLKPIGENAVLCKSQEEAIFREIESEPTEPQRTESEILNRIEKLDTKILKDGPKKGQITRDKEGYRRCKSIIKELQQLHKKCMICKIPHFEKENGKLFSEGAHIIPFHEDNDDSSHNIIILCPMCHRKFDNAKISERVKMYNKLKRNFPNNQFRNPLFLSN